MTRPPALPAPVPADLALGLEDLFVRGTPANTLRAYERDLAYIAAWKQAAQQDGKWATFYAGRSTGEDMAETVRLYLEVRGTPREAEARRRLSNRFALLDRWL